MTSIGGQPDAGPSPKLPDAITKPAGAEMPKTPQAVPTTLKEASQQARSDVMMNGLSSNQAAVATPATKKSSFGFIDTLINKASDTIDYILKASSKYRLVGAYGMIVNTEKYPIESQASKVIEVASANLTEMSGLTNQFDKAKFLTAISKTLSVALEHLTENRAIHLDTQLQDHKVVMVKGSDGRIDVLVQKKLLGKGALGEAFAAVSAISKQMMALKYSNLGDGAALSDLHNESVLLTVLNKDGPHTGVQEVVKLFQFNNKGITQNVSHGKIYSRGDLGNDVEILRISNLLGISPRKLKTIGDLEIKHLIAQKTKEIAKDIKGLHDIKKIIDAEQKDLYDKINILYLQKKPENAQKIATLKEKVKEVNNKQFQLENEITGLLMPIMDTQQLGEDKFKTWQSEANKFTNSLSADPTVNIEERTMALLSSNFFEIAKKCQGMPEVDLSKRMLFSSNLVDGLRHIHKNNIIHGDLKPRNFFSNGESAVIADFGGAVQKNGKYNVIATTNNYAPDSYMGALSYFSKHRQEDNWFRCGQAIDQRSMGISIYEELTGGIIPMDFRNNPKFTAPETYQKIKDDLVRAGVPSRAAEIITKMSKPLVFDESNPPIPFPLQVTDDELAELSGLLKNLLAQEPPVNAALTS